MPFESFNNPASKANSEPTDYSAVAAGSAQQLPAESSLFRDTATTAVALGSSKVVIGLVDDSLTRSVLTKLPSEQSALQQWWVKNSDAAHREIFATHANELAPHLKALKVADAKIQAGRAGMLEAGAVLDQVRAPLIEANGASRAADLALSKLYKAEADNISRVVSAGKHAALYEVKAALLSDTVASLHPDSVGALVEYRNELRGALPGKIPAIEKLRDIESALHSAATFYKEFATAKDWSAVPYHHMERWQRQVYNSARTCPNIAAFVEAASGTAEEVAAGNKLFINDSRAAIAARDYGYYSSQVEAQTTKLNQAKLNITSRLNPASLPEFGAPGAILYKTMGWSGLSTAAGYAADSLISSATGIEMVDRHGNHGARLAIDGALVPAMIMSDVPMRYKAPLAVAAFAGGRAVSYFQANESISPRMSHLLQPTTSDTVLLGGAIMSPLSAKYKAAAIAAALVIGRAVNYASSPEAPLTRR